MFHLVRSLATARHAMEQERLAREKEARSAKRPISFAREFTGACRKQRIQQRLMNVRRRSWLSIRRRQPAS